MASDYSDSRPSLLPVALGMGWTQSPLVQAFKIAGLSLQPRKKAGTFYTNMKWYPLSVSSM